MDKYNSRNNGSLEWEARARGQMTVFSILPISLQIMLKVGVSRKA